MRRGTHSSTLYESLCAQRRERDIFHETTPLEVWPEDIEFLLSDVWGRRCAVTDACVGGNYTLVFTRWDRSRRAGVQNLVLLAKPVAEAHDQASDPMLLYDPARVQAVQCALAWAHEVRQMWRASFEH